MTGETSRGGGTGELLPHRLRAAILGEIHARPFTPLPTPSRILHFGFETAPTQAQRDRANLVALCQAQGLAGPAPEDKHHRVVMKAAALRWEQHSEFTTYTWELPAESSAVPFQPAAAALSSVMGVVPQPGPLLVAVDLHLLAEDSARTSPEILFDRSSLVVAENSDGAALYATDFKPDPGGFVRILVADRGMPTERAGALVQRVLELETYRTLALLGLPEAHRLAPSIAASEKRLVEVTEEMRQPGDLAANQRLLHELTALAADVEAGAAASVFRFGATRAYEEIVEPRPDSTSLMMA
jgi:uncharacterized membrane-anchored protein